MIDITTKATNIELTPDISEYLNKRVQTCEKLIGDEDTAVLCNVEIEKTTDHHQHGNIFRAEINLEVGGKLFRAESSKEHLFDAIDEMQKRVMRELRRDKRKRLRVLKHGGAQVKAWLRRMRGK